VRDAAAALGVDVADSEIIGLLPEAALPPDAERVLHLARFRPDQVLERRLAAHGLIPE
jgi:glutamate formiminotransferase